MRSRGSQDRFRPRPVEHIELNGEHIGRRLVLTLLLLVLGVGTLTYAIVGLLTPETGWQPVEASASAGPTSAEDFTFLCQMNSKAETREVTSLYTAACQSAYRLFHSGQEFEGVVNVFTINNHPNEALEVEAGFYRALAEVVESGRRELYMGPVYERYSDLFFCEDESRAADYDPRLSEAVREEYAGVLAYANDPRAISLELLGENRVRLNVSADYLSWAAQRGPVYRLRLDAERLYRGLSGRRAGRRRVRQGDPEQLRRLCPKPGQRRDGVHLPPL